MNILGLFEEASEGNYKLLGDSVTSLTEKKKTEIDRNSIGFVFQAYHLIDELTVYENIETPLLYQNIPSSERKIRVSDILDRFQIVTKEELFPNQLSGGQQQLVVMGRTLVGQPKIIFADEPTGNLHSGQATYIMQVFKELNQKDGVRIVQLNHSKTNAEYGDSIVNLKDGWLV